MTRFKRFLKEETMDEERSEYIDTIIKNCRPFLTTFKSILLDQESPLYRAFNMNSKFELERYKAKRNRKSRGMNQDQQKVMNDFFVEKFGKKYRSDAMFATFNREELGEYFIWEEKPICFVEGEFNFCYSPIARDMIHFWRPYCLLNDKPSNEFSQKIISKIVEDNIEKYPWLGVLSKDHNTGDLEAVENVLLDPDKFKIYFNLLTKELDYKENVIVDGIKESEVMFDCDAYYLLNLADSVDEKKFVKEIYERL